MNSILEKIHFLRKGLPMEIDRKNNNRYRIVFQEEDGSKTAYYFNSPIYNFLSRKLIDLKFEQNGSAASLMGSNASVSVSNEIKLQNDEGFCRVQTGKHLTHFFADHLQYEEDTLYPATNGIAYKAPCKGGGSISFNLEISAHYMDLRANDKCFAVMREKFRPFMSVSCIGSLNENGELIAPATLRYQKMDDRHYKLTVTPCSPLSSYVLFEINLYEPKLLQDTTVESKNPTVNNAFGGMGFIGNTAAFGEQWLYSRLDFSKFPELMDKQIRHSVLHIPKYNTVSAPLKLFQTAIRFCSFGSTWNNKVPSIDKTLPSDDQSNYSNFDITSFITDPGTKRMVMTGGMILKPQKKDEGFVAIATGDNCYTPLILEINYK